MPSCPVFAAAAQTHAVNTAHSLLCVYRDQFNSNWNSASGWCRSIFGGSHMCRHDEIRRACLSGMNITSNYWLAERVDDDDAMHTNSTDCNNFDGQSSVGNTRSGEYCCLEWMKY